jgi:heterodisulfide reductase subunit A-like polyferredoxin
LLKKDFVKLKNDVSELLGQKQPSKDIDIDEPHRYYSWQSHADILVIGGGVIGSSIAFSLLENFPGAINVTVVEKDPTVSDLFV